MFTGIIEALGELRACTPGRLEVVTGLAPSLQIGDSVAVDGCCLTVVEVGPAHVAADLSPETLARTTLGRRSPGELVNLERPVALGGRLGGHLVQGHVDGVGMVRHRAPDLAVELPAELMRYLVEKGSIALDGVSLTVAQLGERRCSVSVVPHTAAVTTVGERRVGDAVNVEVDVVAKYLERLAQPLLGRVGGLA